MSLILPASLPGAAEEGPLSVDAPALYLRLCSNCHGRQGRGHSIAGPCLRIAVPDLTRITERYGGPFPSDLFRKAIDGRIPLHGQRRMPIWGYSISDAEIRALTEYLRGLQASATPRAPERRTFERT